MGQLKYWQAVREGLLEEMKNDDSVIVFGEDVGRAGGPFGATRGFQEEFGERRVRDTPISEATIVGSGTGAAMTGLRPVVEVMFYDFMALVMDQLANQAAITSWISGGAFSVPLTIRTIAAAGRQAGPQHGKSLESWIAHVPGIKVVHPSNPAGAKGLLKSAIREDCPVVVVDSLVLWTTRGEVPEGDVTVPIGEAAISREGSDVTIVAWGAMVHRALAAAEALERDGFAAEVLDLRTLSPLDHASVLRSVEKTGRLVIPHDAFEPYGPGAEICATVACEDPRLLRAPVRRITPPFAPVPFHVEHEKLYFPQADRIADETRKLIEESAG